MKTVLVSMLLLVPTPAPTTFETMNEAATKALEIAYHYSHYYELGGVITKIDGRYAVGMPSTDWSGDSVELNMDPLKYKGEVVASYHSHPCNSTTHVPAVFSPADLHEDRSYRLPGYIADFCTGIVTVFDPATDKPPMSANVEGWLGRQAGKFEVDGIVLDKDDGDLL